ncbi:hypothetical protein AB4571_01905 [Vibrio breoganii]
MAKIEYKGFTVGLLPTHNNPKLANLWVGKQEVVKYEIFDGYEYSSDERRKETRYVTISKLEWKTYDERLVFSQEELRMLYDRLGGVSAAAMLSDKAAAEASLLELSEKKEAARVASGLQLLKDNWASHWVINPDGTLVEGEGRNLDKYGRGSFLYFPSEESVILKHKKEGSFGEHTFEVLQKPTLSPSQLEAVKAIEDSIQARYSSDRRNGAGRRSPWIGHGFGLTGRPALICEDEYVDEFQKADVEKVAKQAPKRQKKLLDKPDPNSPFAALAALKR